MLSRSSICAILDKHGQSWSRRALDSGETTLWLPVVRFDTQRSDVATSHSYGLLKSGEWVAEYSDKQRLMSVGRMLPFFPLLDLSHRSVVALVQQSVVAAGLPAIITTTFPLDALILSALPEQSYWGQRATAWIDSGYPLNDAIAELRPEHPLIRQRRQARLNSLYFTGDGPVA